MKIYKDFNRTDRPLIDTLGVFDIAEIVAISLDEGLWNGVVEVSHRSWTSILANLDYLNWTGRTESGIQGLDSRYRHCVSFPANGVRVYVFSSLSINNRDAVVHGLQESKNLLGTDVPA